MNHMCQNNSVWYHRSCRSARAVQGQERGAGDARSRHGAEQHPRSCSQRQRVTSNGWKEPTEEACALFYSAFLVLLSPAAPPQLGHAELGNVLPRCSSQRWVRQTQAELRDLFSLETVLSHWPPIEENTDNKRESDLQSCFS